MDVLAANDQENLVHSFQAAAAGKPLNAGLKGFGAKTPGNKAPKTPFKISLNDENAVFKGGKSVLKTNGKGGENLLMTTKKGGKFDDNAFVTPAGPRTRAPLGMKTTNAKATAFQTPAPVSGSAKTQKLSPRLRRPKVKVHQPEAQDVEEDDVPEVEYMPPKEVPLPDNLDDDMPPIDWSFPMFKGANMTRKYSAIYANPIEDDGRTRGQREFEEGLARDQKKADERFDEIFSEAMAKEDAELMKSFGVESPKKPAPKAALPKQNVAAPSTIRARSAATALAPAQKKPSYAAPTVAARSRLPTSMLPSRKPTKPSMNPSTSRNAAAVAASKSTIGYAQGRKTGSSPRKPLSNVTRPPPNSIASRRPTTASSNGKAPSTIKSVIAKPRGGFSRSASTASDATLVAPAQESYRTAEDIEHEMRILMLGDDEEDDEDVDKWMESFRSQVQGADPIDEQFEDFQLQMPADF
ncbi:hypothetical protein K491DRAFT_654893 [Lophiostoma macrostomum CBS 122681]|uniref:Uncharacterized protein n=1 Tax=Lophiostoma macrostomum CBS 122681 TaxID=1314788 RepID=A0A6A6TEF6_9PLEO|nr:hypothetical protein K491DRAFT_654893 [Lophiostoma macrostomum CBS 122681]